MNLVKYAGKQYEILTVEECGERKIYWVKWRSIFRKWPKIQWVLDDEGMVQPVVHLFRRTILVTPMGTVSRTSQTNKLLSSVRNYRLGGRGYLPPGDGELTEKHMAFALAYIHNGMDELAAFRTLWKRYTNERHKQKAIARNLVNDPKIRSFIVTSMSDQLGNFGIGIEFACQKMKEAIEDKNMPATVKADLLKTLFKMHGALPSARTTPPMLGGGVFPGGEVVPFNEIPPEQLGVHADADRRDKEIEDGSPGDDVEE